MEQPERERLRLTFAEVAEQYDRVRPTYPAAVFDDIASLGGIPGGGRILEIGPGTGQATLDLARRGYRVVAVELAPALAELACRNLAAFPEVEVVVADFEAWEPERAGFDAIVSFTAFHWLAEEARFERSAQLLRPGGALAVVATHHVTPADADPVWAGTQEDYDAVVPHPENRLPPPPEEAPDLRAEFEASGRFERIEVRRHRFDVTYTADEWIAVLGTYSPNIALPAERREELFRRIHRRIAARPGGRATRHYLAALTIGRRL